MLLQLGAMQNFKFSNYYGEYDAANQERKNQTTILLPFLSLLFKSNMSSRNGILRDEDNLSECFVASRRINYLDYNSDTLHTIINEHCIVKGQPIVVSNMNKSTNWDSQMFTLNKLKEYRGNLGIY